MGRVHNGKIKSGIAGSTVGPSILLVLRYGGSDALWNYHIVSARACQ